MSQSENGSSDIAMKDYLLYYLSNFHLYVLIQVLLVHYSIPIHYISNMHSISHVNISSLCLSLFVYHIISSYIFVDYIDNLVGIYLSNTSTATGITYL
jgi:hypothetical protein